MTNEFSEGLEDAIERFGEQALNAIEDTILDRNTKSSIGMEALQYVGYTDLQSGMTSGEEQLSDAYSLVLQHGFAMVPGLGLASLDDPKSVPALEKAF